MTACATSPPKPAGLSIASARDHFLSESRQAFASSCSRECHDRKTRSITSSHRPRQLFGQKRTLGFPPFLSRETSQMSRRSLPILIKPTRHRIIPKILFCMRFRKAFHLIHQHLPHREVKGSVNLPIKTRFMPPPRTDNLVQIPPLQFLHTLHRLNQSRHRYPLRIRLRVLLAGPHLPRTPITQAFILSLRSRRFLLPIPAQ